MSANLAVVTEIMRGRSSSRAYKNGPEGRFARFAYEHGWFITKRGWPDFLCLSKNGEFFVVECKPPTGRLKAEQVVCVEFLEARGIRCFVTDGTKLHRYARSKHAGRAGLRLPR